MIEELNEEDQQLKNELEMLVARLKVFGLRVSPPIMLTLTKFGCRNLTRVCIYLPLMPLRTSLRLPRHR